MPAFLAPCLVELRNEINFTHPRRDKASDGWIGDPAHAARVSDHNPDPRPNGVVRATDTDKDGILTEDLLHVVLNDPRTEYVIWNGFIWLRSTGFRRQVYTGANKHTGHMHVSIRKGAQFENDRRPWGYALRVLSRLAGPAPVPGAKNADGSPWGSGKPLDVVAREVLNGEWGNGTDRQKRLTAALYKPSEVQAAVNRLMGMPVNNLPSRLSVGVLATQVINLQWGKGQERINRLTQAGYDAKAVQAEVNRRLK